MTHLSLLFRRKTPLWAQSSPITRNHLIASSRSESEPPLSHPLPPPARAVAETSRYRETSLSPLSRVIYPLSLKRSSSAASSPSARTEHRTGIGTRAGREHRSARVHSPSDEDAPLLARGRAAPRLKWARSLGRPGSDSRGVDVGSLRHITNSSLTHSSFVSPSATWRLLPRARPRGFVSHGARVAGRAATGARAAVCRGSRGTPRGPRAARP